MRSILTLAALLLTVVGCESDCDHFYDVYESCGYDEPGEDVAAMRERCETATAEEDACAIDYEGLGNCIDKLDDACSYPDECGSHIERAYYHCTASP
jgi:hypothetical protein